MSNLISVYILLLLLSTSIFTQNKIFIPVNTAQDVLENYLTAMGGRDNLEKLESVTIEGIARSDSMEIFLTEYIGDEVYFIRTKDKNNVSISYYNFDDNTGWYQSCDTLNKARGNKGGFIVVGKKEIAIFRYYWYLYLNEDDYNLTYKFNKTANDSNAYCIDVYEDKDFLITLYFNKTNFTIEKVVSEEDKINYKDYREIKKNKIILPYVYETNYTLTITSYKFNSKFDKSLLRVIK